MHVLPANVLSGKIGVAVLCRLWKNKYQNLHFISFLCSILLVGILFLRFGALIERGYKYIYSYQLNGYMNVNIQKLYEIAGKPVRRIAGLMSGTSFDGLDVALCEFSGSGTKTEVKLLHFTTVDYNSTFKQELKSVFSRKVADLEKITLLNAYVGNYFGKLVLDCLAQWKVPVDEVDLIASHGQTIFHAPQWLHGQDGYGNATLQIGDADHLAVTTGIITLSDFRQKHIAAGGEGAPLAVYGDFLVFSHQEEARIMLNIGGIANFTFLPAGKNAAQVFSTDVGPGNTLMDQYIQWKFPGMYYDKDAAIAASGVADDALLAALLDHSFFSAPFPKTTGPELFNLSYIEQAMQRSKRTGLAVADVMATLAAFSARAIIQAIAISMQQQATPFKIYLSGGGMHNPLLNRYIEDYFGKEVFTTTAALAIHPDAKEAVLFALLANEAVAGGRVQYGASRLLPSVSMGKISFPL